MSYNKTKSIKMKKRIYMILKSATTIKTTNVKSLELLNKSMGMIINQTKRDIKLVVSNINSSFYLLGQDFSGHREINSELNYKSYENLSDIIDSIKTAIIPSLSIDPKTDYSEEFIIGNYPEKKKERWYFINGIATSKQIAKLNGKALAEIFKTPIHVLYNPSKSLPIDLLQSVLERTYGKNTIITDSIYNVIKEELKSGRKIKLIGHSQGGIIGSSVINRLVDDVEMKPYLKKIELYTFGSAGDRVNHHHQESKKAGRPIPYNEHFVNTHDFIARIGKGAKIFKKQISGDVYEYESTGHLLNSHYLKNFIEGRYDPKEKSQLKKYYNKKKNNL